MPTRLTAAMEEAYAAAPTAVVILHTLELDHPSFDQPIRVVTGDEGSGPDPDDDDPEGGVPATVDLTLETGLTVPFTPLPFDITPPGYDDDGPTQGKVRIDGVSNLLVPYLEQASVSAGAIAVTYRAYRSDVRSEPGDVITGLKLRQVDVTATTAEGAVGFDEVGQQAFPRVTYNIDDYPGIFIA